MKMAFKVMFPRTVLLNLWFVDRQHQHPFGDHKTYFLGPTQIFSVRTSKNKNKI